jgi:hypothetical protein
MVVGNTGDAPTGALSIRLAGDGHTQFRITDDECSSTSLSPGSYCSVYVAFAPTEPGVFRATFAATAVNGGATTGLLRGVASPFTLSPRTLDFGTSLVNVPSSPQAFTVTNQSSAPAGPIHVSLTGGGFSISSDACTGQILAPAAHCDINVVITPTGDRDDAALTASVTDPSGELLVWSNLQGYGSPWLVSATGSDPILQAPVGTTVTRTFTLINTGPSSVGPVSTRLTWYPFGTNPFSLVRDGCNGLTLAAGATCSVDLSFTADGSTHSADVLADTPNGGEGLIGVFGISTT